MGKGSEAETKGICFTGTITVMDVDNQLNSESYTFIRGALEERQSEPVDCVAELADKELPKK